MDNLIEEIEKIDKVVLLLDKARNRIMSVQGGLSDRKEAYIARQFNIPPEVLTPEKFMSLRYWTDIQPPFNNRILNWFESKYSKKGLDTTNPYVQGQFIHTLKFDQTFPFKDQMGLMDFWPYVVAERSEDRPKDPPLCRVMISDYGSTNDDTYTLYASPDKREIFVSGAKRSNARLIVSDQIEQVLFYIYQNHPHIPRKRFGLPPMAGRR